MATTIQLKRGTGSAVPSSLADGEVAINLDSGKLFYGSGSSALSNFSFGDLIISGAISSSGNIETSYTGSFGNLVAEGNITANGNIVGDDGTNITNIAEVQCDSIAADAGTTTKIQMGAATIDVLIDDNDVFNVSPTLFTHDIPVRFVSHITASGNISSSGNIETSYTGSFGNLVAEGNINANGNIVGDDTTDITNIRFIYADRFIADGDSTNQIQTSTSGVTILAKNTTVFNSTISGSILPNIHQNIYNTGSSALGSKTGIGDIVKFGGTTTVAGGMYYLKPDGTWALTQANAVGTATSSIAIAVGTNSTTYGMCLRGLINPFLDPGAPIGNPVYMSDTHTGRMLSSAPASSGDIVRIVGYQFGADLIYFNPDNTYVEIA